MIIGVLSQKGGVGKTTIAVNLAATYAKSGLRTLLVDADPQGSSMQWSEARDAEPMFSVIGMAKTTLHKDLPEIAKDYQVVIIDGAPRVNELGRAAILASDLVLIPVQPSPYDIWAAAETVRLITEAQQYKPTLKGVFVINRKIANTAIGRDVTEALGTFENIPVLPTALHQRVIYAESAGQGLSVLEVDPKGGAAREVAELAKVLMSNQERKAA
jgi:chromosome partitioning protein